MIRKAFVYTRAEAWSRGASWSSVRGLAWTWNWSKGHDCSWSWTQPRRMSNFIFGSLPRSWEHNV